MMYDRAEELGKSTVWHGAPLSLFHSLSPTIRVQDGIKKAEVLYLCVGARKQASFFFSLSIASSHFLSLILSFKEKKGRGNRPKKGKNMYEKKTDKS